LLLRVGSHVKQYGLGACGHARHSQGVDHIRLLMGLHRDRNIAKLANEVLCWRCVRGRRPSVRVVVGMVLRDEVHVLAAEGPWMHHVRTLATASHHERLCMMLLVMLVLRWWDHHQPGRWKLVHSGAVHLRRKRRECGLLVNVVGVDVGRGQVRLWLQNIHGLRLLLCL
jgi:hypothetical protein